MSNLAPAADAPVAFQARTYVVTGGAGFIGSNIVAALEARGDEVIVADWLGEGCKWRNIAKRRLAGLVAPEQLFETLNGLESKPAAVIHMGAISSTMERDADLIAQTNIRLPQRLWQWCALNGVTFVYASSAATYGDGAHGFIDRCDDAYLSQLRPLNAYGWSKLHFDRWACHQRDRGNLAPPRWAGLKYFNVYGPNEAHKGNQRSVATQVYEQIAAGTPVRLFKSYREDYADGGQLRDFVSVDDCVAITLWLADAPHENGLFNAGTGVPRSFLDLARAVGAAAGCQPKVALIEMPEELKAAYQYHTRADMTKLAAAGGPVATGPLEDGIRSYVCDFLATGDPHR